MLAHVGSLLLIGLIMSRLPDGTSTVNVRSEAPPQITWIASPAGGGGSNGNHTPEPPRNAVRPGRAALTVPVSTAPKADREPPKETPRVEQQIVIPAVPMASGVQELPGVVSSLPSVVTASLGPGSGGVGGRGKGSGGGDGEGPGAGSGRNGGYGDGVYPMGSGVSAPRLIKELKPGYTPDAMRAKIQGMVTIQAVVLPDGTVGAAQITRSLDSIFGLDQEAVKTVRQWRFIPGTLAGRAVPVLVEIELVFTLR